MGEATSSELHPTPDYKGCIPGEKCLVAGINFRDVADEVKHTARVTPLVVVPRHDFDEVVVQRNASLCIENGRVSVPKHIRRHNIVLGVSEDTYPYLAGVSVAHDK